MTTIIISHCRQPLLASAIRSVNGARIISSATGATAADFGRRCFSSNSNSNKIIDLRSDTVTAPSRAMLATALTAPTGDDVLGEDPTVHELQTAVAHALGKRAGLFVPTGTMSNLVALLAHCHAVRDAEVLLGASSHLSLWEGGNLATLGGLHVRQLFENAATAQLSEVDIRAAFALDDDDHCAPTRALCLENTHNMLGGVPLSVEYTTAMGDLCQELNLRLHVDGARIFHAATAHQVDAAELCRPAHSVSVCLSKGLGAPLGSVLVSDDEEFLRIAKRWRKKCGGGMRQAGVVAAMGLYALQNNVERLVEDHANARRLADKLEGDGGFVLTRNVDTNLFYFTLPETNVLTPQEFAERLLSEHGVKVSHGYGKQGQLFRVVTHLDVSESDIDRAAHAMLSMAARGVAAG